jgi:hypothetical protein
MTGAAAVDRAPNGPRLREHQESQVLGIPPGDPDWDTARRPWNLRVDQRPTAIVEPEGADDMAVAAAFAARHGFHCAEPGSRC